MAQTTAVHPRSARRDRRPAARARPATLAEVLDRIEGAAEEERVTLDAVLDALGRRSFGPLLLLPGLVMVAPIVGDIPGVPVLMGAVVFLTAGQILLQRRQIWLPGWLLRRSVKSGSVCKTAGWLRRPAAWIDRHTRRRWTALVHHGAVLAIALACLVIAAATPLMEVVPMSANLAGLAITSYGLALVAEDGLLAAIALVFTAATFAIVGWGLLA